MVFIVSDIKTNIIINSGDKPLVFEKVILENIYAIEINSDLPDSKIPIE